MADERYFFVNLLLDFKMEIYNEKTRIKEVFQNSNYSFRN